MKDYITVYELIQRLTEFDPDLAVRFKVWATPKQIDEYKEEWEGVDDGVCFECETVDEVGPSWTPGKFIEIVLKVEDL